MHLVQFLDLQLSLAQFLLESTNIVLSIGERRVQDADVIALLLKRGTLCDQLDFLSFFGRAKIFVWK